MCSSPSFPKTALSLPVFLFETLLKTYKDLLTPEEQQSTEVCRVSGERFSPVSHSVKIVTYFLNIYFLKSFAFPIFDWHLTHIPLWGRPSSTSASPFSCLSHWTRLSARSCPHWRRHPRLGHTLLHLLPDLDLLCHLVDLWTLNGPIKCCRRSMIPVNNYHEK